MPTDYKGFTDPDRIPITRFWKLSKGMDTGRFQLSINFNFPCEFRFQINNFFPNFNLNMPIDLKRSAKSAHDDRE